MTAPLRRVLVRPPQPADAVRWREYGWRAEPDLAAAAAEHEALREILEGAGAEVIVTEGERGNPDAIYAYDPLLVGERGAVLLRPGKDGRLGEPGALEDDPTIGIESDGSVKAEPTLPSAAFIGGNVRERSLREIVESSPQLGFNLGAGTPDGSAHLWGFCRTCEFAELCRGGSPWMSFIVHNKRGNNPYCHHRALTLAERGRRERVVQAAQAPGLPFDTGEFRLVEEALDAPWPEGDELHFTADQVVWPSHWERDDEPAAGPVSRPPAPTRIAPPAGALLPRSAWRSRMDQLAALVRARQSLLAAEAAGASDPWSRTDRGRADLLRRSSARRTSV